MPRSVGTAVYNNFVKGMITEASPLSFPENACSEAFDCVFDPKGSVYRRFGIDYETGATTVGLPGVSNFARSEYIWEAPGGIGSIRFAVVQVGPYIVFYEVDEDGALSTGRKTSVFNINNYKTPGGTNPSAFPCRYASGGGVLIIVNPMMEIVKVTYTGGQNLSISNVTLTIRDFEGWPEHVSVDTRSTTLQTTHLYNLRNQGWPNLTRGLNGGIERPIEKFRQQLGSYPSNSDVWWLYRNADNEFDPNIGVDADFGDNTAAPKGHFILNAFYQDRHKAWSTTTFGHSNIPATLGVVQTPRRPSVAAFYAGRAWYSGVEERGYNSNIYFSKIIETTVLRDDEHGQCYQQQDPTSPEGGDLLPSDGGVINIPEIAAVTALIPRDEGIYVFATNGIWLISGNEGIGFTATDYSVRKVSNIQSFDSSNSYVDAEGNTYWWAPDGIYGFVVDPQTNATTIKNFSNDTIKTFFNLIPTSSRKYAKGAYNPETKTIQWLYNSETKSGIDASYTYDRILNLNIVSGAFYVWRITQPTSGPRIHGIVAVSGLGSLRVSTNVTDESDGTITTAAGELVTVEVLEMTPLTSVFKYFTSKLVTGSTYNFTWSQEYDTMYVDWTDAGNETDYTSYFITGYQAHGEANKKFQANYINFFLDTEDNASCYVQGIWDVGLAGNTGRFTQTQQIYNPRSNFGIQRARRRIRGSGYFLQLKFESSSGKPFTILGWSQFETGNQMP